MNEQMQQGLLEKGVNLITDNVMLAVIWWLVGFLLALVYAQVRKHHISEKLAWKWRLRTETALIGMCIVTLNFAVFLTAPMKQLIVSGVELGLLAGVSAPLFYDGIWKPWLGSLVDKWLRRAAKKAVDKLEDAGMELSDDTKIKRFARGEKDPPS